LLNSQQEGSGKSNYCALRYPDAGSADYQVVFFAFPFEAIPQGGDDPNNSEVVMGRILDWFGISKSVSPGDVNGDGEINIADVVFLVNYLFVGGPAPSPLEVGDVNCNGEIDFSDAVFLVNYLFIGGPIPPSC
jgi:hypothetical protein